MLHTLTPPPLSGETPPHRLHLFLNPHDRLPYFRHIHEVDTHSRFCLEITTRLPETGLGSAQPRRLPMIRTTAHTPDKVTPYTFPADSLHHQLSIITLVTHLLLSIPCLKQTEHVWNTVRTIGSHQYTLNLIMATITLDRYHKV